MKIFFTISIKNSSDISMRSAMLDNVHLSWNDFLSFHLLLGRHCPVSFAGPRAQRGDSPQVLTPVFVVPFLIYHDIILDDSKWRKKTNTGFQNVVL